jgi:L-threonylcarbamoyladenylate synthase
MVGSRISSMDPEWLERALRTIADDGLIIFPTDTVYGVGCRVDSQVGIERLYRVKSRPEQKPIPVLIGDKAHLDQVCTKVPENAYPLIDRFWPGALTIVLPRSPTLPAALGQPPTVGIRMPDHPVALALLGKVGPMAVTSANISGASALRTASEAWAEIGDRVELTIDGGETPGGIPSTVIDLTRPDHPILRRGPITAEAIRSLLESS